ncbi:MAG TPA: prolyl oligopeptidase family serine peptidase, partial [Acidobacteriota bacterium]|nr:prolyl oligopeptidase family serine peptidase [Acidobacteriota bacterium]
IQHGEKDARVPPARASELAAALRRNKVETEYEIYPGQGHVIMSPRFQRRSLETNLEWFVRRLVKLP